MQDTIYDCSFSVKVIFRKSVIPYYCNQIFTNICLRCTPGIQKFTFLWCDLSYLGKLNIDIKCTSLTICVELSEKYLWKSQKCSLLKFYTFYKFYKCYTAFIVHTDTVCKDRSRSILLGVSRRNRLRNIIT